MTRMMNRPVLRLSLAAALALPLAACGPETGFNKGMQSVHQPVVAQQNYIYDVQGADGSLSPAERGRLTGWLDSLDVGYGDHVAIAMDENYVTPAMRDGIAEVLSKRGMLIEEDSSAQAGRAPYGSVRLILRRATASVPGCPNWNRKQETDMVGGLSSNYGCATNGNLAAMVADANDLVRGQAVNSDLRTATSNNAIKVYREKAPTGSGGLQSLGGN